MDAYCKLINSTVRAYTRVNPHTGQAVQVGQYDNNREPAYHGTTESAAKSIQQTGLEARKSPNGVGVWAAAKKEEAFSYAIDSWARATFPGQEDVSQADIKKHGDDLIAVIHVDKSAFPPEHQGEDTLISTSTIPKDKVRKVEYYKVKDAVKLNELAGKIEDAEADKAYGEKVKVPKLVFPKPVKSDEISLHGSSGDKGVVKNSNPGHAGRPGQRGGSTARLELRHYGHHAHDVIDPSKHGTGLAGAESARKKAYPKLWVDRSYWYLPRTSKEAGVGDVLHKATVPVKSLYDYDKDDKDFYGQAVNQNKWKYAPLDDQAHQNVAEGLIKKAGYLGCTGRIGSGKAAALFYPVKTGEDVNWKMKNSTIMNTVTVKEHVRVDP